MSVELDRCHEEVPGDYYNRALEENFGQRFWHQRRFLEAGILLDQLKAENILDLGCHGGRFTNEILLRSPKASITGVDVSSPAIKFAQSKYPKIKFLVSHAQHLPFSSNYFDLVTCFEMLEHVDDPEVVLLEAHRVLKADGNFLVMVPVEEFLFRFIWFVWTKFGPGRVWRHVHVQKFNQKNLRVLLERSGFNLVKEKKFLFGMLLLIQARCRKAT